MGKSELTWGNYLEGEYSLQVIAQDINEKHPLREKSMIAGVATMSKPLPLMMSLPANYLSIRIHLICGINIEAVSASSFQTATHK